MFVLFILSRILFIASMVFIIGYVFGNFSKNAALKTFTKVAAILVVVLFISSNIFFFRGGVGRFGPHNGRAACNWHQTDSIQHYRY